MVAGNSVYNVAVMLVHAMQSLYFHTDKPQPMEAELPQSVNTESPQRAPALHFWENNHIHCSEPFLMETPSAKCLITDLPSQCNAGRKREGRETY